MQAQPRFILEERFGVGESPVWDAHGERLFWCDIPLGVIHALHLESGKRQSWFLGEPVGSFGLAQGRRLVVGLRNDVVLFDPETGARERVAHIPHPKPGMRLNDGKVGPDGAFWIGSMDMGSEGPPAGALHRVAPDGSVRTVLEGLVISNGLAWNADATRLYHSDSRGTMWLDCWDFDRATGTPSNRRRLRDHDEATGRCDGGACDRDGVYWSAGPSRGRINRFASDGTLLGWIDMPLAHPTMPCFGGPDLKTVFVTSLDSKTQSAGRDGIVAFDVAVPGVPIARFGA